MRLKASTESEFNRLIENEILPMLRKQAGMRDEITFVAPGSSDAGAISSREVSENCETYGLASYPELLKMANVVEGTPGVETLELSNSTLHKLAVSAWG